MDGSGDHNGRRRRDCDGRRRRDWTAADGRRHEMNGGGAMDTGVIDGRRRRRRRRWALAGRRRDGRRRWRRHDRYGQRRRRRNGRWDGVAIAMDGGAMCGGTAARTAARSRWTAAATKRSLILYIGDQRHKPLDFGGNVVPKSKIFAG